MSQPVYKDVSVDAAAFTPGQVERAVQAVSDTFLPADLYLTVQFPTVTLHLNQLDVRLLRATLTQADNVPRELAELLCGAVEAIKSYGVKNGKRHFSDYNAERKVVNRKQKEADRSRHYYANDNGFSTVNVPFPAAYENQIVCGDSLEVLRQLPDNCVDIVITSPPYNFGLDYAGDNDTDRWDAYYTKLFAIFSQCIRVLKYGGRFVVNIQPLYSDYIPTHHIITNFFLEQKMIWKGEILWEKNNYNCKYCSWGSWQSPASPYLKYTWEFIEVFCKGDLKKAGDKDKIDITAEEFKQWVVAKWSIAPERHMKEFGHPAMFPEELVRRALKLFSFQGDVVLDPFNGAGTTSLVAAKTGRRYLGIDVSETYGETARKRLTDLRQRK